MRRGTAACLLALSLSLSACPSERPAESSPSATPSTPASPSTTPSAPEPFRWVSGDVHLHTESNPRAGRLEARLAPEQVLAALEREGLEVGVILSWGVRPERTAQWFRGPDADLASAPRVLHVDLETSSFGPAYTDHVIALGLKNLAFPKHLYTRPIEAWAAQQGAVVGVAHATHWTDDPLAFPQRTTQAPSELPACLALGQELFLVTELVDHAGFRFLWYGLLNCGFRVPLAGGSDWPVAGDVPGQVRTYVGLEGPLTYRAWIEGIRAGRTVVAAGRHDRLTLQLGQVGPGGQLDLAQPGSETATVGYHFEQAAAVDLIVNGVAVATQQVEAGAGELSFPVELSDSAWLAARSQTVHTSALYALIAERPIRASAASARYFEAHVGRLLDELRSPEFLLESLRGELEPWVDPERERAKALAAYAPAKQVFARIAAEAEAR